jgi:hypothetical protein
MAPSEDSDTPSASETVADDNLLLSPVQVATVYEQVRLTFPDKHLPVNAPYDQMVEVVRAFLGGSEMTGPSG